MQDAKEQIARRLREEVVDDEEFVARFFERHSHLESEFYEEVAKGPRHFDDWLDSVVNETAQMDFRAYWPSRGEALVEGGALTQGRIRAGKKGVSIVDPWQRQAALSQYLAGSADAIGDIRRFRKNHLQGGILDAAAATEFLTSPHAASRREFFARQDGTDALLRSLKVEVGEDEKGPYKQIVVQGKKRPRPFTLRPVMFSGTHGPVFPGDLLGPRDIATRRSLSTYQTSPAPILFPHPEEPERHVVVKEGSVLAELVRICHKRLRGYPIDPEKGLWFILTGEFIATDPVHSSYTKISHFDFTRSTITLEVESWMSPEEVAGHYRHAQRQVVGKTPRSLESKSLAIFEFVNSNNRETWDTLVRHWNEVHPTQRFGQRGHLYQAYQRAVEKIVGVKPEKAAKRPKMVSKKGFGSQIFADRWYILHDQPHGGYTGYFESREEALADPRSKDSEVVTSEELVVRKKSTHVG